MTETNNSELEIGKRYLLDGTSVVYIEGEIQDFSDGKRDLYSFLSEGTPKSPDAEAITEYKIKGKPSVDKNGAINLEGIILTKESAFKISNEERYMLLSIELEIIKNVQN